GDTILISLLTLVSGMACSVRTRLSHHEQTLTSEQKTGMVSPYFPGVPGFPSAGRMKVALATETCPIPASSATGPLKAGDRPAII
ncbi:MAG: hypothetical protein QUV05_18160, partial [Phycisphaerae bacterium]|nr:hypothetical protein [Phycisphaerae bacterium]